MIVSARASSARWALLFRTNIRPSWRQAEWSAIQNSTYPLRAATRCTVMTHDAVKFSGAISVVYRRASPACCTGSQVTPLPGAPSPNTSKRSRKKIPQRFINRAKGVSYAWSDPMHKCPLLLELMMHPVIGGLQVLAEHPC